MSDSDIGCFFVLIIVFSIAGILIGVGIGGKEHFRYADKIMTACSAGNTTVCRDGAINDTAQGLMYKHYLKAYKTKTGKDLVFN